jgi:hypothetical protein
MNILTQIANLSCAAKAFVDDDKAKAGSHRTKP